MLITTFKPKLLDVLQILTDITVFSLASVKNILVNILCRFQWKRNGNKSHLRYRFLFIFYLSS